MAATELLINKNGETVGDIVEIILKQMVTSFNENISLTNKYVTNDIDTTIENYYIIRLNNLQKYLDIAKELMKNEFNCEVLYDEIKYHDLIFYFD